MKVDTSKIPGFDGMTAEQKAAISALEFPDAPDYSGYVKKELYDKAASDVAAWKKKHNDLLSEEERKKQEREEQYASLSAEVEALRREKTVSDYKAKLIAQGYAEALAGETAVALADGKMDKVFANQQAFITSLTEDLKKEMLKSTPRVPAGVGMSTNDYAKRISEANERGDTALVAALMREQQESKTK